MHSGAGEASPRRHPPAPIYLPFSFRRRHLATCVDPSRWKIIPQRGLPAALCSPPSLSLSVSFAFSLSLSLSLSLPLSLSFSLVTGISRDPEESDERQRDRQRR